MVKVFRMTETPRDDLCMAIDEVLAWSSMFHHHLSFSDLFRNLQQACSEEELKEAVAQASHLRLEGGMILSTHHARNPEFAFMQRLAQQHLEDTSHVLSILAACPYITGLSITGSVAAGMNGEDGDVDVLIITKPGWVWRVRALAIYLSHKHPKGRLLCPNMVMAEDSLSFSRSLYSAREMMQMIPVKDTGGLAKLYRANRWVGDVLPNAEPKARFVVKSERWGPWWWRFMTLPVLGPVIERWESSRRIKELMMASKSGEAVYTKSVCRGHEHQHKQRIETTYKRIVEAMP